MKTDNENYKIFHEHEEDKVIPEDPRIKRGIDGYIKKLKILKFFWGVMILDVPFIACREIVGFPKIFMYFCDSIPFMFLAALLSFLLHDGLYHSIPECKKVFDEIGKAGPIIAYVFKTQFIALLIGLFLSSPWVECRKAPSRKEVRNLINERYGVDASITKTKYDGRVTQRDKIYICECERNGQPFTFKVYYDPKKDLTYVSILDDIAREYIDEVLDVGVFFEKMQEENLEEGVIGFHVRMSNYIAEEYGIERLRMLCDKIFADDVVMKKHSQIYVKVNFGDMNSQNENTEWECTFTKSEYENAITKLEEAIQTYNESDEAKETLEWKLLHKLEED
ncbi:MAG: hypothetical protein PUG10_09760 [Lachnospiraceae bacterium]|nr:hypothetical protein [Lachnospiraceae bacterium]